MFVVQNYNTEEKSFKNFIVKTHKQTVAMVSGTRKSRKFFSLRGLWFCTPKATALLFINFNFLSLCKTTKKTPKVQFRL